MHRMPVLTTTIGAYPKPAYAPVLGWYERRYGHQDNPTKAYVITRHAYSDGAFMLFRELLEEGYQFTILDFLDLASPPTFQVVRWARAHANEGRGAGDREDLQTAQVWCGAGRSLRFDALSVQGSQRAEVEQHKRHKQPDQVDRRVRPPAETHGQI